MSDDEPLSEPLREYDFRPIDVDMPGDWATNVVYTIQIDTHRGVTGNKRHVARVYNAPADSLELPRCEQLACAYARGHVDATRRALKAVYGDQP